MLFGLTFLTGLALGMYVYITAFKPTYAPENLSGGEASASDWSITGKRRGGTEASSAQPAFRVLADGSYLYRQGGLPDENVSETSEGKLAKSLIKNLTLSEAVLQNNAKEISEQNCSSDRGGYDYEYKVLMAGEVYLLDTCSTVFATNSALVSEFGKIWQAMAGKNADASTGEGGWLERLFYERWNEKR